MAEHFSIESVHMQAITQRVEELTRWLAEKAPYCTATQKQLDEGTIEQAYWHYGYLCALRDMQSMVRRSAQ